MRALRAAALAIGVAAIASGCPAGPRPPPPQTGQPLPVELVGDWSQRTMPDATGAYQRRIFRFRQDGTYEYWNEYCASYNTNCSGAYESGLVQVSGQTLAFIPQTPSAEGQRAYAFQIAPDATGALTLRLQRPTDIDVFYFGPP